MEKTRQYSALTGPCGRRAFRCLWILTALGGLGSGAAASDPVSVPSGQAVTLIDVIANVPGPDGLTTRFRFLAPGIAHGVDFDTASEDMHWLCVNFALPRIATTGPQPAQIIISLSDRPVAFGDSDPDVVQFFEGYRPASGQCEPEAL